MTSNDINTYATYLKDFYYRKYFDYCYIRVVISIYIRIR